MKVLKKFLWTLSMLVTVLFAGSFMACSLALNSITSSKKPEQPEVPVRITATYEQTTQVFADTPLEDLRADLTVTVETSAQNVNTVDDYTLSGTLAVGESVITVTYQTLKATFSVTVSEGNVHTHVFTNYVDDHNAACEKDGTKTAKCDYEFCQETDVITIEGTALQHVFTSYESDDNAKCEKDGTKTASCDNGCGKKDTVTDEGTALQHTFTIYASDGNAKCEQDGTKTASCDNGCGNTDTIADEGSALQHAFTAYASDGNATCQKDGTKTANCDNGCGKKDTITDERSIVDHKFENYRLNDDAECEKDGTKTGACKYGCGETETVDAVGSALGHEFKLGICQRCPKTNHISVVTAPSVTMAYYGEKPTVTTGLIKNELEETVTNGTWSISGVDYLANATSKAITTKATATFTPNGTEYAPVSTEISLRLTAVAKYGENYYATVDGALAKANESNTGVVYALPLGNSLDGGKAKIAKTISVVTEIKSGVTLSLPYAETDLDAQVSYVLVTDSDEYKTSAYGKQKFLQNQIYIAESHTLANAGRIDIAGEVSGGESMNYATGKNYANSVTAGRHAQINLGANAKLTSTGTVNCYGFINEESKNNGSEFVVENGEATVLFTIVEYRGGSVYFGMIDPSKPEVSSAIASAAVSGISGTGKYTPDSLQVSPINRFYIESVTAKTTVQKGAEMVGHAVLFAEGENHQTTVNLINDTDGIIALTGKTGNVTYKYDYATHKTDLDMYGDMTLNPLNLQLTISKSASSITTTVCITLTTGATGNSSGVFFPISDYFDISLNAVGDSATVNALLQKVKLLPGAKLTIGENVTVNANEIAVYANNNLFKNGVDTHYTTATPAELLVKGTLNVNAIGGTVKVGGTEARLNITKASSVISKEISGMEPGKSTTITVLIASASLPYTGVVYSSDADSTLNASGATANGEALGVKEYCVQDGKWCPVNVKVSLNLNGGTASATSQNFAYGYALKVSDVFVPTRTNYEFLGWYTTENFANGTELAATNLTKDLALYAKWQQMQGKILVEFKAVGTDANDVANTGTFGSQEIDANNKKATQPTKAAEYSQDVTCARYVAGYYADANGTVAFDFSQEITESTTIYVKWVQKITVTITKSGKMDSSKVTVGGKEVSETTFYVTAGTEIKVTAEVGALFSTKTIKITESYGGKEESGSSWLGTAKATLTFTASGDTTVSIVGS